MTSPTWPCPDVALPRALVAKITVRETAKQYHLPDRGEPGYGTKEHRVALQSTNYRSVVPRGKHNGLHDSPKAALDALWAGVRRDRDLAQARLDRAERQCKLVQDCLTKLAESMAER